MRFSISDRAPSWTLAALLLCAGAPRAAVAVGFDEEAAWSYLVTQVEFGPRNPGSEGHRACLDWILGHLAERADQVQPHTFVMADPYGDGALQLTNVRAIFRPEARVRYAFAAHWDTRPRADAEDPPVGQPIPGANDGASGVAVLLALADWLAEVQPEVGIDLLFFDGEDYGVEGDQQHYLLGSRRFVEDFPGYRPAALILLDMVGKDGLAIPMEGYSLRHAPLLTRAVFNRALTLGLDVLVPRAGPAVLDDHVPFLERGIPALVLIDMDYPAWHTLGDTPEQCSPESLGQIGTLLTALVREDFGAGGGFAP